MSILEVQEEKVVHKRIIPLDALEKAIQLKCTNCYGAMSFANALGGTRTDAWYLCHKYTLKELLDEATYQNLDLTNLKTSIGDIPVKESLYYKRATGELPEQEFRRLFREWQNSGGP